MVTCDYFSASDDDTALRVLDEPGGADPAGWDVVPLKGIDPVVATARLEAVLTGCTYEEAAERPRSGQPLSSPEAESAFVVSVSSHSGRYGACESYNTRDATITTGE
ncbi:hypothetical protein [Streptomyces viridochromogenes]|uniref:Uncharacterized protein n=1 Tax=Streptomyces viridochromogenes Tue57 TaxID=1160705 RepID=L8PNB0_STRVR|nr:hypothetical protein [Streptomyces viridochromogenes]ELS57533.1 hypothetical protein STVIR_1517 [Streptomyces viridochromogenes Tue57]